MMTGQLKACGLTKSYWKGRIEVPVLRGVDLEVDRGEMVAVAGSSGSGKSTLLHILGLLDGPDSGEVWFEDARIDNQPEAKRDRLRNRTFGFIFQFYHLLPELIGTRKRDDAGIDPARALSRTGESDAGCGRKARICWNGLAWGIV